MKKLNYLILTFLFLVTGALPLFAEDNDLLVSIKQDQAVIDQAVMELIDRLCELKCKRQYEACLDKITDQDPFCQMRYSTCSSNCSNYINCSDELLESIIENVRID